MTSQAASPGAIVTRTPRWVLALLFVSIALNLLVIGLVAGTAWRFRHGGPQGWLPPNLIGYSMSLERDRHKALREATSPMRQALRPLRKEIHAARNELNATIVAEPFDLARFERAQARLVELENTARNQTQALYSAIVKSLTPDERHAYIKWRENRRPNVPSFLDEADGIPGGPPRR